MQDGFIKVAAVTPKIKVADPQYNAEEICSKLQEAVDNHAKIIVFPELCISSYTCNDLFLQDKLLQETCKGLLRIVHETEGKDALVFVGLPLEMQGKLYNVAAAIKGGKILAFIPKTYIPNYAEFYEARHYTPGNRKAITCLFDGKEVPFGTDILFTCDSVPGLVVGCEICEDMWTPLSPGTRHALAGANVIVNLSASNDLVGKDDYRRQLVASTSARLLAGYIYASAGDGESTQDVVYGGHDMIAENGSMLAESEAFSTGIIYSEFDMERLRMERRRMTTFQSERQEEYTYLPFSLEMEETALTRYFAPMPFVPSDVKMKEKRCEQILSIQANGLKKRYEHIGARTAVIGISGGLDSTLALLVTVRAFDMLHLPRKNIIAVTMPCFGTTERTHDNAVLLTESVGATLREINIKEAVMVHFRDIGQDPENHDITYENGQARERTQILMNVANKEGGLVIGTGDMSELALGWATYNGDHMSMYGVNVGVPKTLVRHLVQYYADTSKDETVRKVLLDILDTPVSPELLPPEDGVIAQKTEDIVGPYELHDFFLYYMLRCGFPPAKIFRLAKRAFADTYDEAFIFKWLRTFYRRFFTQQFKRSCLPDGPKVGSVAVSPRGDLRMPSDACAAAWMQEIEGLLTQ